MPGTPNNRERLVPTLIAGALIMSNVVASANQSADPTVPKDYVIFLGTDIYADPRNEQQPLPVVGGSEGKVVLLAEDGTMVVPRTDVVMSAALEAKVSRNSVTIEAIEGRPVHSPLTDPMAELSKLYNIEADRQEAAEHAARQAEYYAAGAGLENAMTPDDSLTKESTEAAMDAAADRAAAAVNEMANVIGNSFFQDYLKGASGDNGVFDGYEVDFRVSANERLPEGYGVLKISLQDPSRTELGVQHTYQVFRLPEMDSKPRKVIVRRFGLPMGFSVDSYEIHLYSDGMELATNESKNRVEVTADEALQFLILRHMQNNKGANQPPQVAAELRPAWPNAELVAAWENILVTLEITPEGTVDETEVAGTISNALSNELASIVRDVRFLPALVSGQPVAGRGTFSLGELFRTPAL